MGLTRNELLGILLLAGLLAVASACGGSGEATASDGDTTSAESASNSKDREKKRGGKDDAEEKKEDPVPVEVAALERGPIELMLRFSSNLEAEEAVQVVSEAMRQVKELRVEEGDRVRRGDLLLRLQDDEQRSALAKVKSQLEKAEREYERQKRLHAQELISEQVYNDATYELEQLRISYADAERELTYTEVRAPISGTVTQRLVNLGDQVQIGQQLFDLVDFDSIVARIYVPEKHLHELRPGLEARIGSQALATGVYSGRVERISPVVDPKSGTVKVTVEIGAKPGLRPGMYVDVELVLATRSDAVLVPKRAVVYDNDQMYVYRVNGADRVERVYIEAALADKLNVEPLDGLTEGDRVVVAGQAGLKDGALVSIPEQAAGEPQLPGGTADGTSVQRAAL